MAEYTYTNSAKSDPCQQFSPERRQARKAKSGRLTVILLTAVQPRRRGRCIETPEQAAAGFNASPEVYPQLDGL